MNSKPSWNLLTNRKKKIWSADKRKLDNIEVEQTEVLKSFESLIKKVELTLQRPPTKKTLDLITSLFGSITTT